MTPIRATDHVAATAWKALLIAGVLLACGAFVLSSFALSDSRRSTDHLHHGLVQSCEWVGQPTARVLTHLLDSQRDQARAADPRLFPNIPRAVFYRLVHEQIHRLDGLLAEVKAFPPCNRRYPR